MNERKEVSQLAPFEEALRVAANPEKPTPLRPEMIDVGRLKAKLETAGFNMEIGETEREALTLKQFRDYEGGKGKVVTEIIGEENVDVLEAKLLELSAGGNRIISRKTGELIEGSENRGLRQFTARLLAVSLEAITPEEFCRATNKAVWKGLRRERSEEEKQRLAEIFTGIPEPKRTIASIPPGSIEKVYAFLMNGLED